MYEQYTDKQIVEMLVPKLNKGVPEVNWRTELFYNDRLIKALSVVYRSAYIRGQLGRSFIIGEKKTKEPVNTFKVGDKVKFLGLSIEDEEALNNRRFYPPVNTVGEVVELGSDYCFVQWPKGITASDGAWAYRNNNLEKVIEHWVPATKNNVCKGSVVKFVDKETGNCFPPIGTIGRVTCVSDRDCFVQWPQGTTDGDSRWWSNYERLEVLLCE